MQAALVFVLLCEDLNVPIVCEHSSSQHLRKGQWVIGTGLGGGVMDDVFCSASVICHGVSTHCLRSVCRWWTQTSARVCALCSCMSLHIASSRLLCETSLALWLSDPWPLFPLCLSESKLFSEEVLLCHNEYRRKHQAPPLKLNRKLSREAARLVNAHTDQIRNLISGESNCSLTAPAWETQLLQQTIQYWGPMICLYWEYNSLLIAALEAF